jgi:hypothetical protein
VPAKLPVQDVLPTDTALQYESSSSGAQLVWLQAGSPASAAAACCSCLSLLLLLGGWGPAAVAAAAGAPAADVTGEAVADGVLAKQNLSRRLFFFFFWVLLLLPLLPTAAAAVVLGVLTPAAGA